jgi:hypothetical protein
MNVPFILCEKSHRLGIENWLHIDYSQSPHVLWSGRTSSGKSVAAKILLARTILLAPSELQPIELSVIDPKEDVDFEYLDGLPHFYRGEEAPQGFNDFFDAYIRRKEKRDLTKNLKILFVDEFASLVNLIDDKKEREVTQKKLALLLMLSRSRRFSVQLATQQPSAKIFGESGSASREQFGAICLLGDSGAETQQMLFDGDSREKIKQYGSIGGRGVGWLSINGGLAQPVRVPFVENMDKLNAVIRDSMTGQSKM